ncbi:MAG: flagellar biosynthesis protein FlhF [Candidatus Tectomicrobia bacterium]|nr:flagellar biosynthesis protein FlhF [Candidatus Tectomicrobia bacterium]
MQVKTFEAPDIQEALRRVKQEMGPGAVIISTRHVRRGGAPFGIFGKPHVEITAALPGRGGAPDRPEDERSAAARDGLAPVPDAGLLGGRESHGPQGESGPPEEGWSGLTICPAAEQMTRALDDLSTRLDARGSRSGPGAGVDDLRWEIEDLRWTLNSVLDRLDPLKTRGVPDTPARLYKRLRSRGVRQDLAFRLLESARQGLGPGEILKPEVVEKCVEDQMVSMMAPPAEDAGSSQRRVIALIGPAGTGKTTTLAKLAADAALKQRKKAALISMDAYRIGAIEQLRIYAKIIGIPLMVASAPSDLASAVAQHKDADFTFIDTTGRSPRDPARDKELREHLRGIRGLETHLVLNATAKDRDLWESVRSFWPVPFDALLFTRLDETGEPGTIFNVTVRSGKRLSYFSTGQKVPEDLETANPRRLARMILAHPAGSAA